MLQQINIEVIAQLSGLLMQITEQQYTQALKQLHGNSVGQHVRHITEFYQCLLKGYVTGTVNYDKRERKLLIETDKEFTIQLLGTIVGKLTLWQDDRTLRLESDYGTEKDWVIPSSYNRELIYLIEHTIHHLAIIKIGLNEAFPEITVPSDFGVAYSTIRYRAQAQ